MRKFSFETLDEPNFMREEKLSLDKIIGQPNEFLLRLAIKGIEEKFQGQEMAYFHHNINRLRIKNLSKSMIAKHDRRTNRVLDATYSSNRNILFLPDNIKKEDLNHEMLHVASSTKKGPLTRFSGFKVIKGLSVTGFAISEGYTQLLTDDYLNDEPDESHYPLDKRYARCIQDIVGKYDMMFHYFTGNLKGLMRELRRYYSYEEIAEFILDMDEIHLLLNLRNFTDYEEAELATLLDRTNDLLMIGYERKFMERFMSDEEKQPYMDHFDDLVDMQADAIEYVARKAEENIKEHCSIVYKV